MNRLLQFKSLVGELKDLDTTKRIVTGYLSAFGNKDHDGDIIEQGAFAKSISERKNKIFFLNQHNWSQPHGKFNVLKEDSKGLYFESKPLLDTTYSSDLLKLYDAGVVKEHSIGFQVIVDEWDRDTQIRTIKEVKLFEGSNVTLGANSKTPFTGMKGLNLKEIDDQSKLLIKAIRNGTFTDDTFALLELALKQLQLDSYNLGFNNKESLTDEPPNVTHIKGKPISEIIKEFTNNI